MNIIWVINKGKDNINRDKIPSGVMKNCIYHIVENQNSDDIERIIDNLFNRMDFGEKENYRYTKDYLEAEKVLKKEETLFKKVWRSKS